MYIAGLNLFCENTGVNPRYVLRNWMAEMQKAERNDFSELCVCVCSCSLAAPGLTVFYFCFPRWRSCTAFYPPVCYARPQRRQVMQQSLQPGHRV